MSYVLLFIPSYKNRSYMPPSAHGVLLLCQGMTHSSLDPTLISLWSDPTFVLAALAEYCLPQVSEPNEWFATFVYVTCTTQGRIVVLLYPLWAYTLSILSVPSRITHAPCRRRAT
eukprot:3247298-Amphidinium_carterae.3